MSNINLNSKAKSEFNSKESINKKDHEEISILISKNEDLLNRKRFLKINCYVLIILNLVLIISLIIIKINEASINGKLLSENQISDVFKICVSAFCMLLMIFCSTKISSLNYEMKESEKTISILKEELFFREIIELPDRLRAEKLFEKSRNETQDFYSINMKHTKILFPLGIVIIFIGIVLVCLAFLPILQDNFSRALGIVSGLLIDFIGAIFVAMYNKNLESSVTFFAKLIDSNKLMYTNIVLSEIEDPIKRDDALIEVAKGIANNIDK